MDILEKCRNSKEEFILKIVFVILDRNEFDFRQLPVFNLDYQLVQWDCLFYCEPSKPVLDSDMVRNQRWSGHQRFIVTVGLRKRGIALLV